MSFQTLQQHFGLGLTKTVVVEPEKIRKDEVSYYWKLPQRYRSVLMNSRVQLMENGQHFSRTERINSLLRHGEGWFLVAHNNLRFIPTGGGSPRDNGRRYEAVMPVQYEGMELWGPWIALLGASLMVARRGTRLTLPGQTLRYELALVFVFSCVVTAWRVQGLGVHSDGAFSVCGEPQSDAAGWFMLAQGIAEGWGITGEFSGQRPIYSVIIAPLYFLPGNPVSWFLGFNVVLLGVAAAALYSLASSLFGRLVSLVTLAAVLWGDNHLDRVVNVSTETAGLALGLVSILALAQALREDRRWFYGIGGALVGLANLTSCATILSIPAIAFLVLVADWVRGGLRKGMLSAAVFTLGVSLVLLPWMVRQKVVFDTFSPSLNSGTLLRSGADPSIDWADIHNDPQRTGGVPPEDLAGAQAHHMKHFRSLVAADPAGYVHRVLAEWLQSFEYFRVNDPGHRAAGMLLLLLLSLAAVLQRGNAAGLIVALILGVLWYQIDRQHSVALAIVVYAILLWHFRRRAQRWLILLMLIHLGSATFLVGGMAANQTIHRTWQVMEWSLQFPALGALGLLWAWLSRAAEKLQPWCRLDASHEDLSATESVCGNNTLIVATTSYCLLATIIAVSSVFLGPDKTQAVSIQPALLDQARQYVAENHPQGRVQSSDLHLRPVRLGYRQHFQPAGHDPASWLTHLAKAPRDRWFYNLELADVAAPPDQRCYGAGQTCLQPRNVSPDQPILWISQSQIHQSKIDGSKYTVHNGLAVIPIINNQPDLSRIQWLQPCPMIAE